MAEYRIYMPDSAELALRWHEAEPLMRLAVDIAGCWDPIHRLQMAMSGKIAIWFIEREGQIEAVADTELHVYPRKRVLEIPHIGGCNMARWSVQFQEAMIEHARNCGCSQIAGFGRKGWLRAFREIRQYGVLMVRDVPTQPQVYIDIGAERFGFH